MLFLYYPPCSTCKKAQKWLNDNGVIYTERHIKEAHTLAAQEILSQNVVAKDAELYGIVQGICDAFRHREVHISYPQGHYVVVIAVLFPHIEFYTAGIASVDDFIKIVHSHILPYKIYLYFTRKDTVSQGIFPGDKFSDIYEKYEKFL